MIDEEAAEQARLAAELEFQECIGVDDFLGHVYSGREKGIYLSAYMFQPCCIPVIYFIIWRQSTF